MEPGEDSGEAAERETKEETGFSVKMDCLINQKKHPQFPVYVYYYACRLINEERDEVRDPEIETAIWVNSQEISRYFTSNLDEKVAEYLA